MILYVIGGGMLAFFAWNIIQALLGRQHTPELTSVYSQAAAEAKHAAVREVRYDARRRASQHGERDNGEGPQRS